MIDKRTGEVLGLEVDYKFEVNSIVFIDLKVTCHKVEVIHSNRKQRTRVNCNYSSWEKMLLLEFQEDLYPDLCFSIYSFVAIS